MPARRRAPALVAMARRRGSADRPRALSHTAGSCGGAQTVETARGDHRLSVAAVRVLNATGYVVAQRKAAVASKATGRLEWLGVPRARACKEGEVIARLENRDVVAQARAGRRERQASRRRTSSRRRPRCATRERSLKRSRDLVGKNFVSRPALDTAMARARRAAAVANARGRASARRRRTRNAAGRGRPHADPRAVRRRGAVEERERRRHDHAVLVGAAESKGAVVTMADMGTLEVEADVSESSLGKVKVGQPCGDPARRAARRALPRRHQPHGADRRSREGDGDDQGPVRRAWTRASCRR